MDHNLFRFAIPLVPVKTTRATVLVRMVSTGAGGVLIVKTEVVQELAAYAALMALASLPLSPVCVTLDGLASAATNRIVQAHLTATAEESV